MKHTQTHTRDILVTHSLFVLLSLCPPGCCTWFLSHSSPSLSPTWLRVLTTLNSPDVPASGYALPFVFNKLSCSPFLGAVMYFPFLFLFSSFIWCPKLGVAPPIIFDSGVYLFSCFFPPPYLSPSLLTYSASVLSLSFCYTLLGCPPRKHFSFTCLWAYPYYILWDSSPGQFYLLRQLHLSSCCLCLLCPLCVSCSTGCHYKAPCFVYFHYESHTSVPGSFLSPYQAPIIWKRMLFFCALGHFSLTNLSGTQR